MNNRIKLFFGKSINYNIERNYDSEVHFREYTAREIKYLAKEAGFQKIDIRYRHFSYPNVNNLVNLANQLVGFFLPSTKSNIIVIAEKKI